MQAFKAYLLSIRVTTPKGVDFYLHWVRQFYRFSGMDIGQPASRDQIEAYLRHLSKKHETWQVEQAATAIKLYQFFEKRQARTTVGNTLGSDAQWKAAADDMRNMLRLMHRSQRTETDCLGGIRRF